MYVCMYVCMSVTGLRLKYTGLCIVYVPLGMCSSGCHRDSRTRKIEDDARTSPMYGRWLTAQQKDERRQDNGDKKRLAHQHWSDLLRSLIRERDRRRTALLVSTALRASPFQTFHVLRVRHMMRMRIQVDTTNCVSVSVRPI